MPVRITFFSPNRLFRAFSCDQKRQYCQVLLRIRSLSTIGLNSPTLRSYQIRQFSDYITVSNESRSRSASSCNDCNAFPDVKNRDTATNFYQMKLESRPKQKYFFLDLKTKPWEKSQEEQSHSSKKSPIFSSLGLISTCCLMGYGIYKTLSIGGIAEIFPSVHADNRNKNNFIADVVEKAGPAVVFLEILGRHPLSGREVTVSNGSGFIVRSNGIILTNAHVVANKSAVSVKLHDGSIHQGQVTAVDPVSDLATVKIPANNLPSIPLGESSKLRPGEWVIALGSPLSLSNTVTCGIVSSVQRGSKELGLRNKDMDYIQTDAVINFGNSGGPLVDLEGRAIGINTMKVTTGISFAIPSDHASKFLNKAEAMMKRGTRDTGFLKRRYMGITMLTLTDSIIRELQKDRLTEFRSVTGGVFVYKVIPGSPAHTAGLLAGDIITEIDGRPVKSAADVYDAVEKAEHLSVSIIRGQIKRNFAVNTKETI